MVLRVSVSWKRLKAVPIAVGAGLQAYAFELVCDVFGGFVLAGVPVSRPSISSLEIM